MMDPVMGGSYKDVLEPAHFPDELCMDKDSPDLCGGIHENYVEWIKTCKRQRNKINEAIKGLKHGRPETNCKIHLVGGMVGYMNRPKDAHFVVEPVQPVVKKIFRKYKDHPVNDNLVELNDAVTVKIIQYDEINCTETKINKTVDEKKVKICGSVFPVVKLFYPVIAQQDFDTND